MSWSMLERLLESDVFNQNPFLSVSYLSRYANHVGIHYVLCNKLRQFPYEEIEFFLPQLCHLIISVDNESMALEEFLLDLCEESVTAALLTFWLFQTYLRDLSSDPHSESFKTCRRVYNKVQHIVFGLGDAARHEKIQENIIPVTVLASLVLAGVAVPTLSQWAGPLAVAQARKPQPAGDVIPESPTLEQPPAPPPKPTRSQTVTPSTTRSRRTKDSRGTRSSEIDGAVRARRKADTGSSSRPTSSGSVLSSNEPLKSPSIKLQDHRTDLRVLEGARLSTSSLPLPDVSSPVRSTSGPATPTTNGAKPPAAPKRRHSHQLRGVSTPGDMTREHRVRLLRQNYFRCETQFLTALEGISNRLVIVPKPARLSALRAELALITQDLPAEVDIPVICPPTLIDGSPAKSRHHRVVRLNPAEATVLNSAEKVPYLLMAEIVTDDFSFDPDSQENQRLLTTLLAEQGSKKRIFDIADSTKILSPTNRSPNPAGTPTIDSVFEPTSGDLGSSPKPMPDSTNPSAADEKAKSDAAHSRTTSGTTVEVVLAADLGNATPRTDSPAGRPATSHALSPNLRQVSGEQPDFSALATHMRTAAQMLAQLQATSGKRPKSEVAAIRAKIIASMQTLEEQSFEVDDHHGPTFDDIIGSPPSQDAVAAAADADDMQENSALDATKINTAAGEERMENDIKTGGVQRKGDRDDPSAAVFGEAWDVKKERIRRSSPYGWMKNWDLVSVIVKTGADLRQEAFACQLIDVCDKIWSDAEVPVWVKLMRILVTGESSGLIETITNGVSLHSLKRSLTLAFMESTIPSKRRFATLKDHFAKAFGAADSEPYRAAVDAFKKSLAAYSVISYVLQLKDRHNGNLLIDNEGHIIHIDFGFMLSNSPGSVGFEAAPFKLTHEYIEVLGGLDSPDWEDFKRLSKQAFQALRRQADMIVDLVAMMGQASKMPCFAAGVATVTSSLRARFQLQMSAEEAEAFVETDLVAKSLGSYYTRLYDTFQYRTQGIY